MYNSFVINNNCVSVSNFELMVIYLRTHIHEGSCHVISAKYLFISDVSILINLYNQKSKTSYLTFVVHRYLFVRDLLASYLEVWWLLHNNICILSFVNYLYNSCLVHYDYLNRQIWCTCAHSKLFLRLQFLADENNWKVFWYKKFSGA